MNHRWCCFSIPKQLAWIHRCIRGHVSLLFQALLFQVNPYWIQLSYFFSLSLFGFLALKLSKPRAKIPSSSQNLDVFFTSVSAATVSSMSTVEMEVFSDTQLLIMTVIMFVGGEVFVSILGLHFKAIKIEKAERTIIRNGVPVKPHSSDADLNDDHIELGIVTANSAQENSADSKPATEEGKHDIVIKYKSIKTLTFIASSYLVVMNTTGSALIAIYVALVSSAKHILEKKGLKIATFSVFTTVSTFVNCGFVPTNENMIVFRKNPGLLLILIPQILLGNTLYPVCLRLIVWFLGKITGREEYSYMLKSSRELRYDHLFSRVYSVCLAITVSGLVILQMIAFCAMEWSRYEDGVFVSGYEKFVGSLFQVVNSRHAGEYVFDLSTVSSAILVMFVFVMYLPPYTTFLPSKEAGEELLSTTIEDEENKRRRVENIWKYIKLSQLSYLVLFTVLICITERGKITSDPLNFNVLNIVVEVVSAYGNVGFSVGYSCERRINTDEYCKDAAYGFAGRWSRKGKIVLIIVMFFGRLKKFNIRGGTAWTLS